MVLTLHPLCRGYRGLVQYNGPPHVAQCAAGVQDQSLLSPTTEPRTLSTGSKKNLT